MADEVSQIDPNSRNTLSAVDNNGSGDIYNVRFNPILGAIVCEANVTSSNTIIGSTIPGGTAGSVLFLDIGGTLAEDNANFFYDPVQHRLGLGTTTPTTTLDVVGTFLYDDGSQVAGYALITDALGNATWADLSSNPTFITNLTTNATFLT